MRSFLWPSAQEITAERYISGCICCPGTEQWFKFTPTESKTYTIRTTGELDTQGYLYSCCTSLVASNDDFAGKVNFRIVQYLTAGKTYYIRVRAYGNGTGCYTLNVTDSIFASYVNINKNAITLEKGVRYELPITPNYTYKGYNGAQRIPGLSVSIYPSNVDNNMVWWWAQYDSVLDCAYGWDDDGDRYIHLIASETGTAKLYAEDWAGNGSRDECTVTVTVEGGVNGYYNIINQQTNKALNIKGSYLMELVGREEVTIYDQTGSNEQIWNIDDVSSATTYIRSYIDEAYGLNAQVGSYPHKCDILKIVGNETDAAVRLISQSDGSYQIKLANYDRYLTATGTTNGSAVNWSSAQNNNSQRWKLIPVDFEQREAEKKEYHLVSQSGTGNALRVGEPDTNIWPLNSNKSVSVEALSYWNRQRWTIKGTGTQKKLHTQLNDDYVLCNNGSNEAYVSSNATAANSNLTITKYGSGTDLYEIKLTSSNLYLTLSGSNVIWSAYNSTNRSNQIWKLAEQPANLHNGVDTASILDDQTIRALKLGNVKFVIRYYSQYSWKVLTNAEAANLHNRGIQIISIFQDSGTNVGEFTEDKANDNAAKALELAESLNQPTGTAIYFAVDYDASDGDLAQLENYFSQVKVTLNGKYKVGVYGSGKVCNHIKQVKKLANYSWLNHSTGHAGYDEYDDITKYNIKQAENITYNSVPFDTDTAVGNDYGQW